MPYADKARQRESEARYRERRKQSDPEAHRARIARKNALRQARISDEQASARKAYMVQYRRENADQIRQAAAKRVATEESRKKQRDRYEANRENVLAKQKVWRERNKDKIKVGNKVWRSANREKVRAYREERYKTDPQHKLRLLLRSRLNAAVKANSRRGSAVSLLGCSIPEFVAHLEGKFLPGMSWQNWRRDGWHIDHVRALSEFNLTDPAELAVACHFSNMRPAWAEDNLKKGGRRTVAARILAPKPPKRILPKRVGKRNPTAARAAVKEGGHAAL